MITSAIKRSEATAKMFAEALNNGEIKFWADPGHGWLQVPIGLINTLKKDGLTISGYSYKDKNYGYLEEDCDATNFINCFPEYNFRQLSSSGQLPYEHRHNIFIRNCNRF